MSQLSKDIVVAIQNNLSAQVAGELKGYLAEAEDNKKLVQEQKDVLEVRQAALKLQKEEVDKLKDELQALTKELNDLKYRRLLYEKSEKDVLIANMEKEKAEAVTGAYKDCFNTVFRNGMIKRSITGTENIPVTGSNGNSGYPVTMPINKTTTEEDIG